jgi:hypothetical protein
MTIQYVNTGSSPNAGNGDSLRTAFNKINQNFALIGEGGFGGGGGPTDRLVKNKQTLVLTTNTYDGSTTSAVIGVLDPEINQLTFGQYNQGMTIGRDGGINIDARPGSSGSIYIRGASATCGSGNLGGNVVIQAGGGAQVQIGNTPWKFEDTGTLVAAGPLESQPGSDLILSAPKNFSNYWLESGDFGIATTSTFGVSTVYDSVGNLYVFGNSYGSPDGHGGYSTDDLLVAKYDPFGNNIWQKVYRDSTPAIPPFASADSAAFDRNGNLFFIGNNEALTLSYIAKMTPDGEISSQLLIGNQITLTDIAFDKIGFNYIYVSGYQYGNSGYTVPTIVSLDENYGYLWTVAINTLYTGAIEGIVTDNYGSIYAIGFYTNVDTNVREALLVKIYYTGEVIWQKQINVSPVISDQQGWTIGIDNNSIYTVVTDLNLNGSILTKFDLDGKQIWQSFVGIGYADRGRAINFDDQNNIYISGPGVIQYQSLWMAKINPNNGTAIWMRNIDVGQGDNLYTDQLWWGGHKTSSIYKDRISLAAYSYFDVTRSVQTPNTAYMFLTQLATSGEGIGTYGNYNYRDLMAAGATVISGNYPSVDKNYAVSNPQTGAFIPALAPRSIDSYNTLTNHVYELFVSKSDWSFNNYGQIKFPDGTVQSTAYQSPSELINGNERVTLADNGTLTVPGLIKSAGTANIKIQSGDLSSVWFAQYGDQTRGNGVWGSSSVYDSAGNLYVIGTIAIAFNNTIAGVLLKYDTNGVLLWQKAFEDSSPFVTGESIAIDSGGNIWVIANNYINNLPYIVKFNSTNGNILDQFQFSNGGAMTANDFAIDTDGNFYVVGANRTTGNSFVLSFSQSHQIRWYQEFGNGLLAGFGAYGAGTGSGANAVVVNADSVYITGQYGNDSVANSSMYTARFNTSNGTQRWIVGSLSTNLVGISLDVDSSGNVYVLGGNASNKDVILCKYDQYGHTVWATVPKIPAFPFDLSLGSDGYLYLTGGDYLQTQSPEILFWVKLDTLGNPIKKGTFGSGLDGAWYFFGHRIGGFHENKISLAGYTYQSTGTAGTYYVRMLTAQLDTTYDQVPAASVNNYSYETTSTFLASDAVYYNATYGSTNNLIIDHTTTTIITTNTSNISSFNFTATNTFTSYRSILHSSNSSWEFTNDGNITFPDGTIQNTAWTGKGIGGVIQSNTPPDNASTTTLWYDTVSGRTFVYYENAWVDTSVGGGGGGSSSPLPTTTIPGFLFDNGNGSRSWANPKSLYDGVYTATLKSDGVLELPSARASYGSMSGQIRWPDYLGNASSATNIGPVLYGTAYTGLSLMSPNGSIVLGTPADSLDPYYSATSLMFKNNTLYLPTAGVIKSHHLNNDGTLSTIGDNVKIQTTNGAINTEWRFDADGTLYKNNVPFTSGGLTSITAGTGTHINTSTGNVTIWADVGSISSGTINVSSLNLTAPGPAKIVSGNDLTISAAGFISVDAPLVLSTASTSTLVDLGNLTVLPGAMVYVTDGKRGPSIDVYDGANWNSIVTAPANTGYDVARLTTVTKNNIVAQISNAGKPQISITTGTISLSWTVTYFVNSGGPGGNFAVGQSISAGTFTDIDNALTFSQTGDMAQVLLQNPNDGTVYRITYLFTVTSGKGTVVIEQLV